jgi:hypothetical protein
MPNTPDEKTEQRLPKPDSGQPPSGKKRSKLRILILATAVVVLLVVAYASGVFRKCLPAGFSLARQEAGPVLGRPPSQDLLSQEKLLSPVGSSSVEAAKVPTGPSVQSTLSVVERKPQTCPPSLALPSSQGTAEPLSPEDSESPPKATQSLSKAASGLPAGPRAVETPVIVTKESQQSGPQTPKKRSGATEPSATSGDTSAQSALMGDKPPDAGKGQKKEESVSVKEAAAGKAPEVEDKSLFQLPGSLKVRIHDYSGSLAKWGLMVILDDSGSMTRKTKSWNEGKIQTAEIVVEKIAASLTPGSKLAVRDFVCKKSEEKKTAKAPCLSRMLYEWAESPCSGLKEKIGQTGPGGITNPCAAAAYSLKKDFGGPDNLTPRVILITDGASKCAFNEVAKALDQHKAKGKVGIDVVAVAMGKKRHVAYDKLVKKAEGMLIKIDKPGDLDSGMSRYAKLLRTPTMEKIEVKGDNAVFTTSLEEEITLPPGTYTVVLPVVAGLHPSKKTVPNVKISSGEASILDVKIKKGKPTIKTGKK